MTGATKYWRWWVYLLIAQAFVLVNAFVPMSVVWRLILGFLIMWYGAATGIGIHKENAQQKVLHTRVDDGLKSVHGQDCQCSFCEEWRV